MAPPVRVGPVPRRLRSGDGRTVVPTTGGTAIEDHPSEAPILSLRAG
jgi:hypothetical protein